MTTTTWTLSGFGDEIDPDPRIQVAVLQALGARAIEVRSAWGVNVVELDDQQLEELAGILETAGMTVSAVASPIGKVPLDAPIADEVARLERIVRVAHRLGARFIRVFSFYPAEGTDPDDAHDATVASMRALADTAHAANLVLLHENEKGIYGDTPERVHAMVTAVDSPALRLAWDSANFVQVGVEHPHDDGWALLAPYVDYLQVKDALAATGEVVPAGQGQGQVAKTVAALRDAGYEGFVSLEPHLAEGHELGGFSGPFAFGDAARALHAIADEAGIALR
ncbi:sugar phosphate isomerase/epimerase family protein [Agrococcus jejuensis]|nr:sugar phosphate isomerase/epimerase family protein [Agrococcus jejuensis]